MANVPAGPLATIASMGALLNLYTHPDKRNALRTGQAVVWRGKLITSVHPLLPIDTGVGIGDWNNNAENIQSNRYISNGPAAVTTALNSVTAINQVILYQAALQLNRTPEHERCMKNPFLCEVPDPANANRYLRI
jgi:hypothetical protein